MLLETGIRIQPLPVWEGEWDNPERYSNPQSLANIARDGVAFERGRNFECVDRQPPLK